MRIIALDTATATGYAIAEDGKLLESGVYRFPLQRGETNGIRFLRFRHWLKVKAEGCGLLVAEQAHHRGGAATELCVGFTTRVQEVAAEIGAEYACCHTQALKLYATGNGNAPKEQMIEVAAKRWGVVPEDDNHADAMCLMAWALDGCPVRDLKAEQRAARLDKAAIKANEALAEAMRVHLALGVGHVRRTVDIAKVAKVSEVKSKRILGVLVFEGKAVKMPGGWEGIALPLG